MTPDSPEAQNALGAFFCRNKQQAKGEEMFLKAAANPLYRTPFVAYTNAGVCARSAGNLEQAERYLRQALTSQVDYPETYAQLAGVLHDARQRPAGARIRRALPRGRAGDARHAAARAQHRGRDEGRGRGRRVQGAAREGVPGLRAGAQGRRTAGPESRMSARAGLALAGRAAAHRRAKRSASRSRRSRTGCRLNEALVLAMEEDRFGLLGAPVFARGHLRNYAALVGAAGTGDPGRLRHRRRPGTDVPDGRSTGAGRSRGAAARVAWLAVALVAAPLPRRRRAWWLSRG